VPELFRKRIQFSRLIKADGRLREFNFLKSEGLKDNYYEVDVSDEYGKRFAFTMHPDGAEWKVDEASIPLWIREAEPLLYAAIAEEDR
jgi:hypothetical protein